MTQWTQRCESLEKPVDYYDKDIILGAIVKRAILDYVHPRQPRLGYRDIESAAWFLFNENGLDSIVKRRVRMDINLEMIRKVAIAWRRKYGHETTPTVERFIGRLSRFYRGE